MSCTAAQQWYQPHQTVDYGVPVCGYSTCKPAGGDHGHQAEAISVCQQLWHLQWRTQGDLAERVIVLSALTSAPVAHATLMPSAARRSKHNITSLSQTPFCTACMTSNVQGDKTATIWPHRQHYRLSLVSCQSLLCCSSSSMTLAHFPSLSSCCSNQQQTISKHITMPFAVCSASHDV